MAKKHTLARRHRRASLSGMKMKSSTPWLIGVGITAAVLGAVWWFKFRKVDGVIAAPLPGEAPAAYRARVWANHERVYAQLVAREDAMSARVRAEPTNRLLADEYARLVQEKRGLEAAWSLWLAANPTPRGA